VLCKLRDDLTTKINFKIAKGTTVKDLAEERHERETLAWAIGILEEYYSNVR
jgi:hypothetical protein